MKISLVIPGSANTRRAACRIIEEMGFIRMGSGSGLHAYIEGDGGILRVIVLDWDHPKMGNAELNEQLNILKKEKRAVVILCQGAEEKKRLEQTLSGNDDKRYLLKTFDMNSLAKTVYGVAKPARSPVK